MHDATGGSLWAWLESSAVAQAMRQWLWLYPAVEITHIVGFVLLVGSVVMFDLRLLGLSPRLPLATLAQHLLPWSWLGLALIVPSGLLMFSAHAVEWVDNPVFWIKLTLIGTAGVNALLFHRRIARYDDDRPRHARVASAVSLTLWLSVLVCGRLLAYV